MSSDGRTDTDIGRTCPSCPFGKASCWTGRTRTYPLRDVRMSGSRCGDNVAFSYLLNAATVANDTTVSRGSLRGAAVAGSAEPRPFTLRRIFESRN
jgi:hypothetical protein